MKLLWQMTNYREMLSIGLFASTTIVPGLIKKKNVGKRTPIHNIHQTHVSSYHSI